jgi:multicomponent Na+:H+ antiporter subunit A
VVSGRPARRLGHHRQGAASLSNAPSHADGTSVRGGFVLAGLASLFIWAFLAPWLGDRLAARFGYSAALTSFVLFGWYASQLPAVTHGPTRVETISWLPTLGADLTLRLDGLGLLFALLVTGIGALIALYSVAYLAHHPRRRAFWVAFLAFEAAMLGLVLADDVILLFVFWELTSITSFFLIGLENERERARTSATQALIVTGSGGFALLTGLLILVQRTGSLRLSEILAQGPLDADGLVTTAFLLILLGAAAKSAQVPLHFWLPNAMEAPTPVSA